MHKKSDSRGLSAIVATLLIIMLTLVAVGIIWIVVKNVIKSGAEKVSLGEFTLNLEISQVYKINDSTLNVKVKRNIGDGETYELKFIVEDGENTEIIKTNASLEELEAENFELHLLVINASKIKKISIAPIFKLKSGKEVTGDIADEYILTNVSEEDIIIPPTECSLPGDCDDNNPCTIDTCSDGRCANTLICSNDGQCCSGCSDDPDCAEEDLTFVCNEGAVSKECFCGEISVNSGYCCHGEIRANACSSQQYPVTINTIRYLADAPDGTDITYALQTIIENSKDRDVIVLPQGKFVINNSLNISAKDVSLIGQGANNLTGTVLYRNAATNSTFIQYWDYKNEVENPVFVSGIYLQGRPSERYGGGSKVNDLDAGISFQNVHNFYCSDNKFQYMGWVGVLAILANNSITGFNGLVFNNSFYDLSRTEIGNLGYGVATGSADTEWIENPEFGSNKFLFIEDNHFHECRHSVTSGGGGKYVFRNNLVEDDYLGAIDMHGGGNFGNTISARASEIYNNTIKSQYKRNGNVIDASTVDSDLYFGIVIRGGESLVYNNYLTNYRWGVYLWLENQTPGAYPGSYPVIHQTGYLSGLKYGYTDIEYTGDHGDGDVFAWNNTLTNTWTSHVLNFIENETDDLNFIKFGRDFQTVQKPGYVAYPSPHPYKNYYYSFVNNFMNNLSNLSATNIASTSVRLNWDDVLCEDGYYIYQSTNGVDFVRVDSTGLNEVSHVISGLSGNTQYWFYVKAYNDNHESLRSNITTFTTPI